jgi:hypothetical protein
MSRPPPPLLVECMKAMLVVAVALVWPAVAVQAAVLLWAAAQSAACEILLAMKLLLCGTWISTSKTTVFFQEQNFRGKSLSDIKRFDSQHARGSTLETQVLMYAKAFLDV